MFGKLFPDYVKYKMLDSVSQWGNSKKTEYFSEYNGSFNSAKKKFPSDLYESIEYHPFESLSLPITGKWDRVLRIAYGDYMQLPPEEKRKPKHT